MKQSMKFQAQQNSYQSRKLINSSNVFICWLGLMIPVGIAASLSSNDPLDSLKKTIEVGTLPATVLIGINQLKKQKESELRLSIANEFKDFNNRRETINVRKMLEQEVNVIELFPDAEKPRDKTLNVEAIRYEQALVLPVKKLPRFTPNMQPGNNSDDFKRKNCTAYIEAAIRDNLDKFFTDLEQIQLRVESRGLSYEYIATYLEPWKRMFNNADKRLKGKLTDYVERQEYFNVLKMLSDRQKNLTKSELLELHHKAVEKSKETLSNKKEYANSCSCCYCSSCYCGKVVAVNNKVKLLQNISIF